MRDSFILYTKILEVLEALTMEQRGVLFTAIVEFEKTGEEPVIEDPLVAMAFIPIRQDLELNNKKWKQTCEARSEAGKKSGEVRRNKAEQKKNKMISYEQNKQTRTKRTEHEYEDGNEQDVENERDEKAPPSPQGGRRQKTQMQMVEESDLSEPVKEAVKIWLEYKKERGDKYKEVGLSTLLKNIRQKELEYGPDCVINAINESIQNGYKGMVFDRASPKKPSYAQDTPNRMVNVDGWIGDEA